MVLTRRATLVAIALVASAFVVLAVAVIGTNVLPDDAPVLDPKQGYATQASYERTWKEPDFQPVPPAAPFSEHLQNPILLRVYDSGVYVADAGDNKIRRFSHDGRLLSLIGNGSGQGPGELNKMADFFVRGEEVWVSDIRTQSVSRFDTSGRFTSRFSPKSFPLRVTGLGEGLALLLLGSPQLFQHVDTTGQVLASFGEIITDQVQNTLSLTGYLLPLPDGFLYVPMYASYLYFFDTSGNLERVVQTLDRQRFPGLEAREVGSGTAYYAPDPDIAVLDVSTEDEDLFVLTRFRNEHDEAESYSVLDRYRLSDGAYQESIRLPFQPANAKVHGDRLYCWRDTTITIFEFR